MTEEREFRKLYISDLDLDLQMENDFLSDFFLKKCKAVSFKSTELDFCMYSGETNYWFCLWI
mgnify:CR=1 FL=1